MSKPRVTRRDLPIDEALERNKARPSRHGDLEYLRFMDDFRGVPRGTVVAGDAIVWGYPHIGRVLSLEVGLAEQFPGPFWLEEKIDGYNVRVARLDDKLVALSRGGFVCPFSTDRLPDLIDTGIFEAEPDLVLCAEIAGPGNPYNSASPPQVTDDVALFVFDLMRRAGSRFLGQAEKVAMIDRHGLPGVRNYGRHTAGDVDAVLAVMRDIDAEGREGLVIKDEADPQHRAKYVAGRASVNDMRANAHNIMDLPPEYFTDRILRLALYLLDQNKAPDRALKEELGEALLDGLSDAVRQSQGEHHVSVPFRSRFRDYDNAETFMRHLEQAQGDEVQVVREGIEREGDYWVLRFRRVAPRITGLLGHLFSGGLVYDP